LRNHLKLVHHRLNKPVEGRPQIEDSLDTQKHNRRNPATLADVALTDARVAQSYALGTTTMDEATVELGQESLADGGVAIFTSTNIQNLPYD